MKQFRDILAVVLLILAIVWLINSGALQALTAGLSQPRIEPAVSQPIQGAPEIRYIVATSKPEQPIIVTSPPQQVEVPVTVERVIVVTATPHPFNNGVGVRSCNVAPGVRKPAGCP